jgi:3-oxoadipate enol-lactonase
MYLKTRQGEIYYDVIGPERAPVVLFTHGAGLDGGMFGEQIKALSSQYRVVTWDMPGHGQSFQLADDLLYDKAAEYVIKILDAVQARSAVLVGQSLGSWVSQYAAASCPERVSAIISIGGTPMSYPFSRWLILFYRLTPAMYAVLPESWMFRITAQGKAVTPEARQYYEQTLRRMGKEQFCHVLRGMLREEQGIHAGPPTQPLLITFGEHELSMVKKISAKWHAMTPGSRCSEIPGAGHNANQDNPEAFNRVMMEFLRTLAPAAQRAA